MNIAAFISMMMFLFKESSFFTSPTVSDSCKGRFMGAINNFSHDATIGTFIGNSGKGVGDLGNYKGCTNDPRSRYLVIDIKGLPVYISIGLCVPNECLPDDFKDVRGPLAKLINAQFDIKGTNPVKANLTADSVKFVDPLMVPNRYGAPYIILMSCLGFLVILNVAAICIRNFNPELITSEDLLKEDGLVMTVLHYFDPVKNYRRIMGDDLEKLNPDLRYFNGMRLLCMLWIVFGHTLYYSQLGALTNPTDLLDLMKAFKNSYVVNSLYTVDVFFFMSGFLAFYLIYSELRAQNGQINYIKVFFHRFIRLSVMSWIIVASLAWVLSNVVEGPMKGNIDDRMENTCRTTWYANFLYYNNFMPNKMICGGWLWYLPNDFHFYLLVPIFAYIFYRSKLASVVLIAVTGVGCTIAAYVIAYDREISASNMKYKDDYFEHFYNMPYGRITPHLFGVLMSMMYLEYKNEKDGWVVSFSNHIKENIVTRYVLYLISITAMFWLVITIYWLNNYPDDWSKGYDVAYLTLSKPVFIFFLFFCFYPGLIGKARLLRRIFGHPSLYVFGKLSYVGYMIHPVILLYYMGIENKGEFIEMEKYRLKFFGIAVLAIAFSFFTTPILEYPIRALSRKYIHAYDYPAISSEDTETSPTSPGKERLSALSIDGKMIN